MFFSLAIVTAFIGKWVNFISMAKQMHSPNPQAGTSHNDEYMPMMNAVMLSSTPFKTYGTDYYVFLESETLCWFNRNLDS